jgi:hypothetical protein
MRFINATISVLAVCALLLLGIAIRTANLPDSTATQRPAESPLYFSELSGQGYNCKTYSSLGSSVSVRSDGSVLTYKGPYVLGTGTPVEVSIDAANDASFRGRYSLQFRATAEENGYPNYFCLLNASHEHGLVGLLILNTGDTGGAPNFGLLLVPTPDHRTLRVIQTHYYGYAAMSVRNLGGTFSWLTTDLQVPDNWTATDSVGAPLEILQLSGTRFVNVAHRYPKVVAADAASEWWYGTHTPSYQEPEGGLSAWLGDECILGRGSRSWTLLNATIKNNSRVVLGMSSTEFLDQLRTELVRAGYCKQTLPGAAP